MPRSATLPGDEGGVVRVQYASDGTRIFASNRGGFFVLDSVTLETLGEVLYKEKEAGQLTEFSISPDGRYALRGGDRVHLIDVEAHTEVVFDHAPCVKALYARCGAAVGKAAYLLAKDRLSVAKWSLAQRGKLEPTGEAVSFDRDPPIPQVDPATLKDNQHVERMIEHMHMSADGALLALRWVQAIVTKNPKGGSSRRPTHQWVFYDISGGAFRAHDMSGFQQPYARVQNSGLQRLPDHICSDVLFLPGGGGEYLWHSCHPTSGFVVSDRLTGRERIFRAARSQNVGSEGFMAADASGNTLAVLAQLGDDQLAYRVVLVDNAQKDGDEMPMIAEYPIAKRPFTCALSPSGNSFCTGTLGGVELFVVGTGGAGASPARDAALAGRVSPKDVAARMASYVENVLYAEAEKLTAAAAQDAARAGGLEEPDAREDAGPSSMGCRDANDEAMLAHPAPPRAAGEASRNGSPLGDVTEGALVRWFAWELPKAAAAEVGVAYHHKQQRLVLLKAAAVMTDVAQDVGKRPDFPLWLEGLIAAGIDRVCDFFFALFLYTVNSLECDCPDVATCRAYVAEEWACQKAGRKWTNAAGKASHTKPNPAKPANDAAHGYNIFPWAVMNWGLRVSVDSPDAAIREASRRAAAAYAPFQHALAAALKHLPTVATTVFRGIRGTVTHAYRPGDGVRWAAFSSTSSDGEVARMFMGKNQGTFFIINTHSAASIEFASWYPTQAELLVTCDMEFEVQRRFSNTLLTMLHSNAEIIVMEERNGPPHSAKRAADLAVEAARRTQFLYSGFLKTYVEARLHDQRTAASVSAGTPINTVCKSLLQGAEAGKPSKLVIIGPGGTGKTTSLLATASYLVSSVDKDAQNIFPLFVPLPSTRFLAQGGIDEAVLTELRISADALRSLGRNPRKLVVLLDSLDEVAELSNAKQAFDILARNPLVAECAAAVLLSTRADVLDTLDIDPSGILGDGATVRFVQPFSDSDMRAYLGKVGDAEALEAKLHDAGLWEELRTPYVLTMATDVTRDRPELLDDAHAEFVMGFPGESAPLTLWEVYEAFVRKYIEERLSLTVSDAGARAQAAGQALEQAQTMASQMVSENQLQAPRAKYSVSLEYFSVLPLRIENAYGDGTFCFRHKSLHEYLVARDVYRHLPQGSSLNAVGNLAKALPRAVDFVAMRLKRDVTLQAVWRDTLRDLLRDPATGAAARANAASILAAAFVPFDFVGPLGGAIEGADLTGALLVNADLKNAALRDCNVCHTDWTGADVAGMDAAGCITSAQGKVALAPRVDKAKQATSEFQLRAIPQHRLHHLFVVIDDKLLIVNSDLGVVKEAPRAHYRAKHCHDATTWDLAADGKHAVWTQRGQKVVLVALATLEETLLPIEGARAVYFTPDSAQLIVLLEASVTFCGLDGAAVAGAPVLNFADPAVCGLTMKPEDADATQTSQSGPIEVMAAPTGNRFMIYWALVVMRNRAGTHRKSFMMYDGATKAVIPAKRGERDSSSGVAKNIYEDSGVLTPDGRRLLMRSANYCCIRDAETQYQTVALQGKCTTAALSSSGKDVVMAHCDSGSVTIADAETLTVRVKLSVAGRVCAAVLLDTKPQCLIAGIYQDTALLKVATFEAPVRVHEDGVSSGCCPCAVPPSRVALEGHGKNGPQQILLSNVNFHVAAQTHVGEYNGETCLAPLPSGIFVIARLGKEDKTALHVHVAHPGDPPLNVSYDSKRPPEVVVAGMDWGRPMSVHELPHAAGVVLVGFEGNREKRENGFAVIDVAGKQLVAKVPKSYKGAPVFSPDGAWCAFGDATLAVYATHGKARDLSPADFETPAATVPAKRMPVGPFTPHAVEFIDSGRVLLGCHSVWNCAPEWDALALQRVVCQDGGAMALGDEALAGFRGVEVMAGGRLFAAAPSIGARGKGPSGLFTVHVFGATGDGAASTFVELCSFACGNRPLSCLLFDPASQLLVTYSSAARTTRWWELAPGTYRPPIPVAVPPFAEKYFAAWKGRAVRLLPTHAAAADIVPRLVAQHGPGTPSFVGGKPRGTASLQNNPGLKTALETM
eukprot:TRINITY_DN11057_c0_g5_i1.p1 TRINITY_DN11057_c0_g5~~TRINITY_DN11057_c0_g5_i1.p1  ORF type:complete len:2048 (+),score=437.66 TRINITY_DN11057_c0_g5_i1:123-6266(+)